MNHLRITTCVLLALLFTLPAIAQEAPQLDLAFVLDASGSMKGKIDGKPKFDIARKALAGMLPALAEREVCMSLVVYGHRNGGCRDIEQAVKFGPKAADRISGMLNKLKAVGSTPLAASIRRAGDILMARKPAPRRIVVLTDGAETCNGNPVAEAKRLAAKGFDVKIHVIGFNVSGSAIEQLKAIAGAGNGQFFKADDAKQLADALKQVQKGIEKIAKLPKRSAKGEAVDVGGDWNEAPAIGAGTWRVNQKLEKGQLGFVKISVPSGRSVRVTMNGGGESSNWRGYSRVWMEMYAGPSTSNKLDNSNVRFGETKTIQGGNYTQQVAEFYLRISTGNTGGQKLKDELRNTSFKVELLDHSDADAEGDAAQKWQRAHGISTGKRITAHLQHGYDKDTFEVTLKAGKKYEVRTVTELAVRLTLVALSEDGDDLGKGASKKEGFPAKMVLTPKSDMTVFITVGRTRENGGQRKRFAEYTLKITERE